jgi:hypothetical protein
MRFKAFIVVRIKVMVVWVRGPCSFVVGYGYFRRTVLLVLSPKSAQVTGSRHLQNICNQKPHGDTTLETMFLMGNVSAYVYLGCTALSKVHTENKY